MSYYAWRAASSSAERRRTRASAWRWQQRRTTSFRWLRTSYVAARLHPSSVQSLARGMAYATSGSPSRGATSGASGAGAALAGLGSVHNSAGHRGTGRRTHSGEQYPIGGRPRSSRRAWQHGASSLEIHGRTCPSRVACSRAWRARCARARTAGSTGARAGVLEPGMASWQEHSHTAAARAQTRWSPARHSDEGRRLMAGRAYRRCRAGGRSAREPPSRPGWASG